MPDGGQAAKSTIDSTMLSLDRGAFLSMMRASFREQRLFFLPPPASLEAAVVLKGMDAHD